MLIPQVKYNLKDICICPAPVTTITSRSLCNIYNEDGNLPIFTAPMDTVVNLENIDIWHKYKIIPILPRTIDINTRLDYCLHKNEWIAVSLDEFEKYFTKKSDLSFDNVKKVKVLIDMANGHMYSIYEDAKNAKDFFKSISVKSEIMVGNVANSNILSAHSDKDYWYCDNVDYIRVGIGGGTCCTTTSQCGIHYPMASLISEMSENKGYTKIVADGGIKTYSDAITALALGADYVMIGTTFASLFESASDILFSNNKEPAFIYNCEYGDELYELYNKNVWSSMIQLNKGEIKYDISDKMIDMKKIILKRYNLSKIVYGMSTPEAQLKINNDTKVKVTEGLVRYVDCVKTVYDWTLEFSSYLKSTMSYTNSRTLDEFIGKPDCYVKSNQTINDINKPIDNVISYYY